MKSSVCPDHEREREERERERERERCNIKEILREDIFLNSDFFFRCSFDILAIFDDVYATRSHRMAEYLCRSGIDDFFTGI